MESYPRFIVVSGLIGVGKSTFTTQLAEHLGYEPIFEPVDGNPYLADFYEDPEKWAYPMQEWLKHKRFAAYQFAIWGIRCGKFKGVVMDRSIHEDTVFAEINQKLGNIDPRNWTTYLEGFQDFTIFLPTPDVYVYLDAPPEACQGRIQSRNRPAEGGRGLQKDSNTEAPGIPLHYLETLHEGYQSWLEQVSPQIPTVRVDWREFRPVDEAWTEVQSQLEARSRFTKSLVL